MDKLFIKIKLLREEFGVFKLRLLGDNETLWAVPTGHQEHKIKIDPNLKGEVFRAYLLNDPISWGPHVKWGDMVAVRNNGEDELPTADLSDQTKENLKDPS